MQTQTRIFILPVGFGLGLLSACYPTTTILNDDHCANNTGDAYCAEQFPDKPFCQIDDCNGSDKPIWGCVADQPSPECWAECGQAVELVNGEPVFGELIPCEDTDTDSGTDSTDVTDSDATDSSETGPMLCEGPEDCMDAAAPFCNMEGECVACDAMPEPDMACAVADPSLPVCFASECVACAEGKVEACVGATPICNVETNACEGCSEHEQCAESACNLAEGNCIDPGAVVHVDGDESCAGADGSEAMPYCSVEASLAAVGGEALIVLHARDLNNPYVESNTIAVDVAMFVAAGETARIQGTAGSPGLSISPSGNLFLRSVGLSSGANTGITVNGGQAWIEESRIATNAAQGVALNGGSAWIERSEIVNNTGGGIVVDGGGMLMLENSFVGTAALNSHALAVPNGMFEVRYSTIGTAGAANAIAVTCINGMESTLSNSLVVALNGDPELQCDGLDVVSSALEMDVPDNLSVGDMNLGWFDDFGLGDFHLSGTHPIEINMAALWETGGPATDIDGEPRPVTDGTLDFAGADRIP